MHAFGQWEETHTHTGTAYKLHTERFRNPETRNPLAVGEAVLTTTPLCSPKCMLFIIFISDPLLLPSLRLLVPPVRLLTAVLWRSMQQQDVMKYGMLADFVALVTEAVPELFSPTCAAELVLGLRTKVKPLTPNHRPILLHLID